MPYVASTVHRRHRPRGELYCGELVAPFECPERWDHIVTARETAGVSLGVDTFESDPISSFRLGSDDFTTYGRRLGAMGLPTVYCMEGGYAVAEIGTNTVNVLDGHLEGQS